MHLNLRIIPHASKSGDGIFGVAFLSAEGTGAYSDVSYNSAEELDRELACRLGASIRPCNGA